MSVRLARMAVQQTLPLSVSAANVSAQDSGFSACGNPGGTGPTSVTITNGSGNYSFLWDLISAPAANGPYNISSPSVMEPNWTGGIVCDGENNSETWRIIVTDLTFGLQASDSISVTRNWINLN